MASISADDALYERMVQEKLRELRSMYGLAEPDPEIAAAAAAASKMVSAQSGPRPTAVAGRRALQEYGLPSGFPSSPARFVTKEATYPTQPAYPSQPTPNRYDAALSPSVRAESMSRYQRQMAGGSAAEVIPGGLRSASVSTDRYNGAPSYGSVPPSPSRAAPAAASLAPPPTRAFAGRRSSLGPSSLPLPGEGGAVGVGAQPTYRYRPPQAVVHEQHAYPPAHAGHRQQPAAYEHPATGYPPEYRVQYGRAGVGSGRGGAPGVSNEENVDPRAVYAEELKVQMEEVAGRKRDEKEARMREDESDKMKWLSRSATSAVPSPSRRKGRAAPTIDLPTSPGTGFRYSGGNSPGAVSRALPANMDADSIHAAVARGEAFNRYRNETAQPEDALRKAARARAAQEQAAELEAQIVERAREKERVAREEARHEAEEEARLARDREVLARRLAAEKSDDRPAGAGQQAAAGGGGGGLADRPTVPAHAARSPPTSRGAGSQPGSVLSGGGLSTGSLPPSAARLMRIRAQVQGGPGTLAPPPLPHPHPHPDLYVPASPPVRVREQVQEERVGRGGRNRAREEEEEEEEEAYPPPRRGRQDRDREREDQGAPPPYSETSALSELAKLRAISEEVTRREAEAAAMQRRMMQALGGRYPMGMGGQMAPPPQPHASGYLQYPLGFGPPPPHPHPMDSSNPMGMSMGMASSGMGLRASWGSEYGIVPGPAYGAPYGYGYGNGAGTELPGPGPSDTSSSSYTGYNPRLMSFAMGEPLARERREDSMFAAAAALDSTGGEGRPHAHAHVQPMKPLMSSSGRALPSNSIPGGLDGEDMSVRWVGKGRPLTAAPGERDIAAAREARAQASAPAPAPMPIPSSRPHSALPLPLPLHIPPPIPTIAEVSPSEEDAHPSPHSGEGTGTLPAPPHTPPKQAEATASAAAEHDARLAEQEDRVHALTAALRSSGGTHLTFGGEAVGVTGTPSSAKKAPLPPSSGGGSGSHSRSASAGSSGRSASRGRKGSISTEELMARVSAAGVALRGSGGVAGDAPTGFAALDAQARTPSSTPHTPGKRLGAGSHRESLDGSTLLLYELEHGPGGPLRGSSASYRSPQPTGATSPSLYVRSGAEQAAAILRQGGLTSPLADSLYRQGMAAESALAGGAPPSYARSDGMTEPGKGGLRLASAGHTRRAPLHPGAGAGAHTPPVKFQPVGLENVGKRQRPFSSASGIRASESSSAAHGSGSDHPSPALGGVSGPALGVEGDTTPFMPPGSGVVQGSRPASRAAAQSISAAEIRAALADLEHEASTRRAVGGDGVGKEPVMGALDSTHSTGPLDSTEGGAEGLDYAPRPNDDEVGVLVSAPPSRLA